MKIAVTGATGYIGSALISAIKKRGLVPLALTRTRPPNSVAWMHYDLRNPAIDFDDYVSCVVHLAMNLKIANEVEQKEEIDAAVCILEAAKKVGAKFIYLSSQTASVEASTMYGQTKWKIEKIVQAYERSAIIRPGLVYGGVPLGLFLQLSSFIKKSPFIPYFLPAPTVQPIHVDDLCDAILNVYEQEHVAGLFCIASVRPIKFHHFLKYLSTYSVRRYRPLLPFPRLVIDVSNTVLPNVASLKRLHSLFTLPYMDTKKDLSLLALKLRPLTSGLHSSGSIRRRQIISEGYVLIFYILRFPPNLMMIRRYVKIIESLSNKEPMVFSQFVKFFPSFIALVEVNSSFKKQYWFTEFVWRINIATSIAEASVLGAKRFLKLGCRSSFLINGLICIKAVLIEVLAYFLSKFLGVLIKKIIFIKVDENEA